MPNGYCNFVAINCNSSCNLIKRENKKNYSELISAYNSFMSAIVNL